MQELLTQIATKGPNLRPFSDDFRRKSTFSEGEDLWFEAANYRVMIDDVTFSLWKQRVGGSFGEKITRIWISCGNVQFITFNALKAELKWDVHSPEAETYLMSAAKTLLERIVQQETQQAEQAAQAEAERARVEAAREADEKQKQAATLARFRIDTV